MYTVPLSAMTSPMPPSFIPSNEEDYARRIRLIMRLRTAGVRDTRVLSAMEAIPREWFVADPFHDQAYEDTALPISCGQTISQPTVVAWMTAALDLSPRHTVLEVGTGSGYQAAIFSKLARRVYTIERHRELLRGAENRFTALNCKNIVSRCGDGSKGWPEAAPYDRILVAAAAAEVPEPLIAQLRPGGVMIIPVGADGAGQLLLRLSKDETGVLSTQHLMPVRFVPLVSG